MHHLKIFVIKVSSWFFLYLLGVLCHFVLTPLKSHGNPDVQNDLEELKNKQDLLVS